MWLSLALRGHVAFAGAAAPVIGGGVVQLAAGRGRPHPGAVQRGVTARIGWVSLRRVATELAVGMLLTVKQTGLAKTFESRYEVNCMQLW